MCSLTSLHGFKYIVHVNSYAHMILWMCLCTSGLTVASILIYQQWARFQSNPTIMGIETLNYPIMKVPFPAVTVCNYNKVFQDNTGQLTEKLTKMGLSQEAIDNFYAILPNLITSDEPELANSQQEILHSLITDSNYTISALMEEIFQPCPELISQCKWMDLRINCTELIQRVKTGDGYCCAFNYYEYNPGTPRNAAQKRIRYVSGAGKYVALELTFNLNDRSNKTGNARIMIHDSSKYPELTCQRTTIKSGEHLIIAVNPIVIESSSDIQGLSVKTRNCVFDQEIKLHVSFEYSYESCLTECRIKEINKLCNCTPFFYPSIDNHRTCNLNDTGCLAQYKHIFYSLQPPPDSPGFENNHTYGIECECYPKCDERKYNIETLVSKAKVAASKTNSSSLVVYFQDLSCIQYKRDVYMTWDAFFASFGGIFGLCIGGSLTSLCEIMYFCIKYHFWNKFYAKQENTVVPTIIRVNSDNTEKQSAFEPPKYTYNSYPPPFNSMQKSHRAPPGEPIKIYWK